MAASGCSALSVIAKAPTEIPELIGMVGSSTSSLVIGFIIGFSVPPSGVPSIKYGNQSANNPTRLDCPFPFFSVHPFGRRSPDRVTSLHKAYSYILNTHDILAESDHILLLRPARKLHRCQARQRHREKKLTQVVHRVAGQRNFIGFTVSVWIFLFKTN